MAIDIDEFNDSFNTGVWGSGNTETTTSTANLGVAVDDSFNEDHSTNDSGNLDLGIADSWNQDNSTNDSGNVAASVTDSFNTDSNDTDVDIEDSWNDYSDNSMTDDNSWSSEFTKDSHNSWTDASSDDHSVHVGNRDYSTGFGDLSFGGGAAGGAGGGDTLVNNQNTIVDQSFNANLDGGAWGVGGSSAVVASGDDAMAAGGDINLSTHVDYSQHITSMEGDVNIGNETSLTSVSDSYNSYEDASSWEDNSSHVSIDDSWNDYSDTYSASGSYNDTSELWETSDVSVDVDAIIHSSDAAIVDQAGFAG